jgi:hypothetical protein
MSTVSIGYYENFTLPGGAAEPYDCIRANSYTGSFFDNVTCPFEGGPPPCLGSGLTFGRKIGPAPAAGVCPDWLGKWNVKYYNTTLPIMDNNTIADNLIIDTVCDNSTNPNACLTDNVTVGGAITWTCLATGRRASDNQSVLFGKLPEDTDSTRYYETLTPDTVNFPGDTRATILDSFFTRLWFLADASDNNTVTNLISGTKNLCVDADGDGYDGYDADNCTTGTDCNDTNDAVNPGVTEVCSNMIDDNCNGVTDESDNTTYYRDFDNDTYGDAAVTTLLSSCFPMPAGYVNNSTDCDDNKTAVNPGATEVCNGIDDNCIGGIDEGFVSEPTTCGLGACASTGVTSCLGVLGIFDNCTVGAAVDNDTNCDGIDGDCNGVVDDGYVSVPTTCGVGACAATGIKTCDNATEIDNCTAGTPTAEVCNGINDDCDNATDEGYVSEATACGVGACAATGSTSCVSGGVVDSCTPGSTTAEVCNGIDDDCDGVIDNGLTVKTYYLDADNDTYGNADNSTFACKAPEGYVDNSTGFDCDDNASAVNPGETEVCGDGIDNDCDNTTADDNCTVDNCTDADGDGFFVGKGCTKPVDCDDTDATLTDNCTPECLVKVVPKKIFKLIAIINPIHPYVISAARDSGVEFARPIDIDWGTDAINDIIRAKIGKRIIFGFLLVRPFKLVAGEFDVTVTFGADKICAGTIEVK